VSAIAKRIYNAITDGGAVAPRLQPDDDVVLTLPAKDWAFIRERAKQPMSSVRNEDDYERRQRRVVHDQIAELITHHIREPKSAATPLNAIQRSVDLRSSRRRDGCPCTCESPSAVTPPQDQTGEDV
jgi:hypothetical protein